jgi:Phosphotransferase enzyme family
LVGGARAAVIVADDAEAIASAFGLGDVLTFEGPCARGELGQVWRLSTGSGDWAVKESFEAGGVGDHVVTTEFHEAAVAFGVPAPSVRRAIDGSAAVLIGETPVRVHGWVDLDPPDPAMDPEIVGAAVATLHRLRFTGDLPAHWWNSEPVGADGWDALIDELRTRQSPLAARFARWRDEFVALEGWLAPARAVQVCHRDLFADNLRRTTAGVPCIIDWDNAGDADPNQELAMVLFEFTGDDVATAPILMTSYIEAGGPARVLGRRDFSMTIAVLGHLARRIGQLWLAPGVTAAERVRQERRFDEYDERPFTRDVIDTLLDAIA